MSSHFPRTARNVEIRTTNQAFCVHEYYLNKFSIFATLIQAAKANDSETLSEPGGRTVLTCEQKVKGVDIYDTLRVIYASHIDGIPDFDSNIMASALRIASTFDYPGLRKFAISKLDAMELPASQRIQLSNEFLLPSWETLAFTELCSRAEPISHAEAEILGMTRFVEIARIREAQRTRWAVEPINEINEDLRQVLASSLKPGSSTSNDTSTQDNPEYQVVHNSLGVIVR
ncbi:unnamed protein product [Rhizoctonia solani]|uniref:BTB domain-containing protein n=1 Tax=Rhizoctonia solani TaxID=456999 RepID=A0A8H3D3A4_9AGAM|nr:unnamed protein product [Rhizoctonia solani]